MGPAHGVSSSDAPVPPGGQAERPLKYHVPAEIARARGRRIRACDGFRIRDLRPLDSGDGIALRWLPSRLKIPWRHRSVIRARRSTRYADAPSRVTPTSVLFGTDKRSNSCGYFAHRRKRGGGDAPRSTPRFHRSRAAGQPARGAASSISPRRDARSKTWPRAS